MAASPFLWLGGSSAAGSAGDIDYGYYQLTSSADIPERVGASTLRLWSSALWGASEAPVNLGVITEQQRQKNETLLRQIGDYCRKNGLVISIEDDFTLNPQGWTAAWVDEAKKLDLPISYVDGGENLLYVADTDQALITLAHKVVADSKIIRQAFPSVKIGDVEPIVSDNQAAWNKELGDWWTTYSTIASQEGSQGFSYFIADVAWNSSDSNWSGETELVGGLAALHDLKFGLFIDGSAGDVTSEQWIAQAEGHLAAVANNPKITPSFLVVESWQSGIPGSVYPINEGNTVGHLGLVISTLFDSFRNANLSSESGIYVTVPSQIIVKVGSEYRISGVFLDGVANHIGHAENVAVLITDNDGAITSGIFEGVSVTGSGSGQVLIVGSITAVNESLASLALTENYADLDEINFEVFNSEGRSSIGSTYVLATNVLPGLGEQTLTFAPVPGAQSWLSATVTFGTRINSESYTWGSALPSLDPQSSNTSVEFYSPQSMNSLNHDEMAWTNPSAQGQSGYDPTSSSSGEVRSEAIYATIINFDGSSGAALSSISNIMPVAAAGAVSDPLHGGGQFRTDYNLPGNSYWDPTWDTRLDSVSQFSDMSGNVWETIWDWKVGENMSYSIFVYGGQVPRLWQRIDSLSSGSQFVTGDKVVTEFNEAGNPNWDSVDWSTAKQVSTTFHDASVEAQAVVQADGKEVIWQWDVTQSQAWSYRIQNYSETGILVSQQFTWNAGGKYLDSELIYDTASGKLQQRWDHPAAGGYILTQYDVSGTQPWSSWTQTTNQQNQIVGVTHVFRPGQPDSSDALSFDPASGKLLRETELLSAGGSTITHYDVANAQNWSDYAKTLSASGSLVSEHYDWRPGRSFVSSDLIYDTASGKLQQRWDHPAAGGYILTQYDVSGTQPWSSWTQTTNQQNQIVGVTHVFRPGQPDSSDALSFDPASGKLLRETELLSAGGSTITHYDVANAQNWSDYAKTLSASGSLVSEHYDWRPGRSFVSSDLIYDTASGKLQQRWDHPAAGGYILTQYDVSGTQPWSSWTQTTNQQNQIVGVTHVFRPGQPDSSDALSFDPASGKLLRETELLSAGGSTITHYDVANAQNWSDYAKTLSASGSLVSEHYDWRPGRSFVSSDLIYDTASGKLQQRWDHPAAGGYILTQYDVSGTQPWSSWTQTTNQQNQIVGVTHVFRPGQPDSSDALSFDPASGKLLRETELLSAGGSTITHYDVANAQNWSDYAKTLSASGSLVSEHYDWRPGRSFVSSDLIYDTASGKLQQRWDHPAAGGYILTQYDVSGTQPWSSWTQTTNQQNQIVGVTHVFRPGQPDSSDALSFDPASGKLLRETELLSAGGSTITHYDVANAQNWSDYAKTLSASGSLVSEHYDWRPGRSFVSSDLIYDTASGKLQQRWDHPAAGGYILTQYDVSGTQPWSSWTQTTNQQNQIVGVTHVFRPGQPDSSDALSFDPASGKLLRETELLSAGGSTITHYDVANAQNWSDYAKTLSASGSLVSEHYDWRPGRSFVSSDLIYDTASGKLQQRWDHPAAGGYILTQYDVSGTQPWSSWTQTTNQQNQIVGVTHVFRPGQPDSSDALSFDPASGKLLRETELLSAGGSTITHYDVANAIKTDIGDQDDAASDRHTVPDFGSISASSSLIPASVLDVYFISSIRNIHLENFAPSISVNSKYLMKDITASRSDIMKDVINITEELGTPRYLRNHSHIIPAGAAFTNLNQPNGASLSGVRDQWNPHS